MTINFCVLNATTKSDIKKAITSSNDTALKINFDTGETVYYNRRAISLHEIVTKIYDYIRQTQNELKEAMRVHEPSNEELNAMYEDLCNCCETKAAAIHYCI